MTTTTHLHILNSSSDLFLPLLICCCFFFFFLKSIALPKEKRSRNLPPGPTPLPFIGNLLKLGRLPHICLPPKPRRRARPTHPPHPRPNPHHGGLLKRNSFRNPRNPRSRLLRPPPTHRSLPPHLRRPRHRFLALQRSLEANQAIQQRGVLLREQGAIFRPHSGRKMDGLFDAEIRERKMKRSGRRKEEEEEEEENFLDVLLRCEVHKHPLLGFLLSRNDTKALIMDLFFTATETAAVTVEWGMSELMKNPEAMKKAQEEVRRVVGAGKPRVEEDDLRRLSYLKLVVNETFRLHPAAPLLGPHESMRDTKINGFDIPAKTRVIVNGSAIGRDPKSWTDPDSFQPERFLNNAVNYRGNHYEFIPFGSGRRICPGMGHAVVGVELVFANLLYSSDWELPEGMKEKGLDMEERYGVSISRKKPLILMAEPAIDVSI